MNLIHAFFLKKIDSWSYKVLEIFSFVVPVTIFALMIVLCAHLKIERSIYILILLSIFLVMLFYSASITIEFRKKQIIWLKEHGKKMYCTFLRLGTAFVPSYMIPDMYWTLYVKAALPSGTKTFRSDLTPNVIIGFFQFGSKFENGLKERINKYLESHPEGIPVYINPENPKIYWVDISWFRVS